MASVALSLGSRISRPKTALVYVGEPESPNVPVMTPPLGIQILGSVLRQRGFDAELFDSRLSGADLDAELAAWAPHIVGFSFLSPAAAQATELARRARQAGAVTVAGGPHATICGDALPADAFDIVVRGDGELALLRIVDQVQRGAVGSRVVAAEPWDDLSALPVLDRFACYEPVYGDPERTWRSVPVQFNRGCPMNCQFCEVSRDAAVYALPRKERQRSLERLTEDVQTFVDRWGSNYILVVDSIGTLDDELAAGFLDMVAARYPKVSVQLNAHVNKFSPRVEAALRPFGPKASVWFGFESGSDDMLQRLQKGHTVAQALEVGTRAAATGAFVGANLLIGLPWETADDLRATDEFVEQLIEASPDPELVHPNPNIFHPLPGTPLYTECMRAGLVVDETGHRIWSEQDIARERRGPLRGVDYGRVLETYYRFRPASAPPGGFTPWVMEQ
jgi:radical SAM superfamily enzyme YgiQ (UPF0313 family)